MGEVLNFVFVLYLSLFLFPPHHLVDICWPGSDYPEVQSCIFDTEDQRIAKAKLSLG